MATKATFKKMAWSDCWYSLNPTIECIQKRV